MLFKLLLNFANVILAGMDLQLWINSASKFMKLALTTAELKVRLNTLKILCLYSANEVSSADLVFLIYSHTSSHNNSDNNSDTRH